MMNNIVPPYYYRKRLSPFYPYPVTKQVITQRKIWDKIPAVIPRTINMFISQKNRAELYKKMMLKYGKCRSIFVGGQLFITAFSAEMFSQITIDHKDKFVKGNGWNRIRKFAGEGLLTSEEPTHQNHRKIMQPHFSYKKIESEYSKIMIKKISQKMEAWDKLNKIDVHAEMVDLALDIVAEALFGLNLKQQTDFVKENMDIVVSAAERTVDPMLHRFDHWNIPIFKEFKQSAMNLHHFSLDIMNQRISNPVEGDDLLNVMINSGMSPEEISNQILTLILAGFETTANTLVWIVSFLSDNPDWMDKVKKESQEIIKEINSENFLSLVSSSHSIDAVIKETLRLMPPLWVMPRLAISDVFIDGNFIPKGASVIMSPFPIHRDPETYSEPDFWHPERWSKEFESSLPRGAFIPFGAGSRKCLGDQFAMLEMKLILIFIYSKYNLKTTRKTPKGTAKASYRVSRKVFAKPIDL